MRRGFAILGLAGVLVGCHHVSTAPSRPHAPIGHWTLTLDADDRDEFCVQTMLEPGFLVCTSVANVRAFVRERKLAE